MLGNGLLNAWGGISQIAAVVDSLSKVIGLFGYLLAGFSYLQGRANKRAHDATLNALIAAVQQREPVAVPSRSATSIAPPVSQLPQGVTIPSPPLQVNPTHPVTALEEAIQDAQVETTQRNRWKLLVSSINHPLIFLLAVMVQIAGIIALISPGDSYTFGVATVIESILLLPLIISQTVSVIRLRRWGWLIGLTLGTLLGLGIFSGVAGIIYGVNGPKTRRSSQSTTTEMNPHHQ